MKPLLALMFGLFALTFTLAAQQQPFIPPIEPSPPIAMPNCPETDPCPDPQRPWMRGSVEIQCTLPEMLEHAQEASPGRNIVACGVCKHRCNPFDPNAEQTDNRSWDPACSARCSPKGCTCTNPCST